MSTEFYIHNINPIALNFGFLVIPWYWLFYFTGLIWCLFSGKYLIRKGFTNLKLNTYIDFLQWGFLAMLAGGRIFYALFYNPRLYLNEPLRIFKIWEGGMSFHGAILAIALYALYLSKKSKISFFTLTDLIATCGPLALFFGRIGNFINGELAGSKTSIPWAVVFPKFYDMNPRHPSQIYEAIFEGLIIFIVLWALRRKLQVKGLASSLFLMLYGVFRFFIEFYRLPDKQLGHIAIGLSLGQILCLIMILSSLILFRYARE